MAQKGTVLSSEPGKSRFRSRKVKTSHCRTVNSLGVGCEAHESVDSKVDRWLPPGGGTATSSTVYIENWTYAYGTVSA